MVVIIPLLLILVYTLYRGILAKKILVVMLSSIIILLIGSLGVYIYFNPYWYNGRLKSLLIGLYLWKKPRMQAFWVLYLCIFSVPSINVLIITLGNFMNCKPRNIDHFPHIHTIYCTFLSLFSNLPFLPCVNRV